MISDSVDSSDNDCCRRNLKKNVSGFCHIFAVWKSKTN